MLLDVEFIRSNDGRNRFVPDKDENIVAAATLFGVKPYSLIDKLTSEVIAVSSRSKLKLSLNCILINMFVFFNYILKIFFLLQKVFTQNNFNHLRSVAHVFQCFFHQFMIPFLPLC